MFAEERGKADAWFAALDAARPSAPLVVEFVRLFPESEVNYRYFTNSREPGFDVRVELHERYEFTMQLPVRFDAEGRTVVGYGEPNFYLREVASRNGRETTYDPAGERHFGSAEWGKIAEHGGDFSTIGYLMKTNQPVASLRNGKDQP